MPMIRLHLLGFTPDLKGLVFSGRRGGRAGTYWVTVDDGLRGALDQLEEARQDAHRPPPPVDERPRAAEGRRKRGRAAEPEPEPEPAAVPAAPRVQSRLSPREIQALLREGRSVKDVATRAGVDEAWVDRFLGPVLEEISGIIAMTQRAYQTRARLGTSRLPIGESVVRNLEERRASADTLESIASSWDARRVGRRNWRVRLRFKHRGKRRVAEWELSGDTRAVRPRNELAVQLGWWGRGPRPAAAPTAPAPESPPAGKAGARKGRSASARARKPAAKRRTTTRRG